MRELSFVKKLRFEFSGIVTKHALVIGDADNDGVSCMQLLRQHQQSHVCSLTESNSFHKM